MTNSKKSLTLAALLAGTVATGALAQGVSADVGGGVSADVGGGNGSISADVGTSGSVSAGEAPGNSGVAGEVTGNGELVAQGGDMEAPGQSGDWNYGRIVSSIQTGANADVNFDEIGDDATFDVMVLSEIQGNASGNAQALDNAMASMEGDWSADIEANEQLSAALEESGYEAENVIGIYANADGSYEVLVDDRG
ncbi:MAG: hypothetical protein VX874_00035 [Pseudomonadota bacterium]|nr:hypothetical protein [Pseudomonadota bacterium]